MRIAAANSLGYWWKVWDLRHLVILLVQLDLRNRYRRTVLGIGWSLMNPILMMVVLCAVFAQIFKVSIQDHAPFVLAGIGIWGFLSSTIMEGCNSIYAGEKYIRSTPMPMAIYALRTLIGIAFQFVIILGLTLVITLVLRGYENPITLLALVPSFIILCFFGWSMSVLFGFANVYFPDTQQIANVLLQILFYLTPVFYPPNLIRISFVQTFLRFNPLAALVSIVREPLVYNQFPTLENYLIAVGVTFFSFLLAIRILTKRERTIIFHL